MFFYGDFIQFMHGRSLGDIWLSFFGVKKTWKSEIWERTKISVGKKPDFIGEHKDLRQTNILIKPSETTKFLTVHTKTLAENKKKT